jgi:hypothetical protein
MKENAAGNSTINYFLTGILILCLLSSGSELYTVYDPNAVAVSAGGNGVVSSTGYASSLTQYGITWTFDANYKTWHFVNGDFWVEANSTGLVTLTAISPASTTVDGRVKNGSVINPIIGQT